jgi:hypothetical protein
MPRFTVFACLVSLALAPGAARAEMIGFSYSWSMGPTSVYTGTNPDTADGTSTGSVTFALQGDGIGGHSIGSPAAKVAGATITTSSSGGGQFAADSYATSFSLTLHLTDQASGQSGDATFTASLSGTLTATSSELSAAFDSPVTRQLILGGHVYSVTIDPSLVHVPAPGSSDPGNIDALIRVVGATNSNEPPQVQDAPEPASLLTGAVGSALGLLAWMRRRRMAAQPAEAGL